MGFADFEYRSARSTQEAIDLWHSRSGARYLAGGTDLLPQFRCGACDEPELVIDIKRIPGLWEIAEEGDGSLRVGATATIAQVAAHPLVAERYPALVDCCRQLGSYPLRNIATIAGNICNASPCADTAAALLALGAEVVALGREGERRIPVTDFFKAPGVSALDAGELATGIVLPAESAGGRAHYGRIARRKGVDISTVAALVVHLPGQASAHRIALLSVAPRPLRVTDAERVLDDRGPDGANEAAAMARRLATPIDDVRGSAAYRREMVGVLVRRGVEALAGGQGR